MNLSLLELRGKIVITSKGVQDLQSGHVWVLRNQIVKAEIWGAGLTLVEDERGRRVGLGLYSPSSVIALRMLLRGEKDFTLDDLRGRLQKAKQRRTQDLPGKDTYRLVHGEADQLPGIFIDRYDDQLVLQTTCAGADMLEPLLIDEMLQTFQPRTLVIRNDTAIRGKESLPQTTRVVVGREPIWAQFLEGTVPLTVDLMHDQKTGAFLDQADNHVASRRWARGRGLDCFCYHGGFALQLAQSCTSVLACDQSASALQRLQENAQRANIGHIEAIKSDAFDFLRHLRGQQFDVMVLDPPSFVSKSAHHAKAMRAYQELNTLAMELLAEHGVLITCSCSGHVRPWEFGDMLLRAANKAGRQMTLIERRGAGPDHPVLMGVPETEYLKCFVCSVA